MGFYIFSELRDIYPYNLIAASCLLEAASYFYFMVFFVCPLQVYIFLAYYFPVFGIQKIDNIVLWKYFKMVIGSFYGQLYGFHSINLTIQFFICIDLLLMLKNPFYPRHRRRRC